MATVLPFRARTARRESDPTTPSGRPYAGRVGRARQSGAVPARRRTILHDFSAPAAWAGLTTFIWYAVGMVPVQIAVIGQFDLDRSQVSSWMFIIWATGAVSSMVLSMAYRQPLATTSSLSALIFLGTLSLRFGFADIAGDTLMAGLLVIVLAVAGFGRRLLVWLPMPLAMAMLAGSIMADAMNVVATGVADASIAGVTVAGYVVGRMLRNPRVPPIGLALISGAAAVAVMHSANPEPVEWML